MSTVAAVPALLSWTSANDKGGQAVTKTASGDITQPTGPALYQDYWLDDKGITHDAWDANPQNKTLMWTGCGETAAQGLLSRFGHFATEEAADQHTRLNNNWGGSLDNIRDYYRMRGMQARNYEGITWDEMKDAFANGFGVVTTMSVSGSDHTMQVVGMHTDPSGDKRQDSITWQDTNGQQTTYPRPDFEKAWNQVRLRGLPEDGVITFPTGIHNHCTIVGKPGADLPNRGFTESLWTLLGTPAMRVLDSVDDFGVGFNYMAEGSVAGGIVRSTTAIVEAGTQLGPAIGEFIGTNLVHVGDAGIGFCKDKLTNAGWFAKIFLYPLLGLSYALKYVSAYLIRFPAELVGGIAGFITYYAFTKWANMYADYAHRPEDAINNLRQADANGDSRQKTYWTQLCATPIVPGKTYLAEALLRKNSDESRTMMLRVFQSIVDSTGAVDKAGVKALIDRVGGKALDKFFSTSVAGKTFHALSA